MSENNQDVGSHAKATPAQTDAATLASQVEDLQAKLAEASAIAESCLAFHLDPADQNAAAAVTRHLIDRGVAIPVELHERLLCASLRGQPYRMDLTETLVLQVLKRGGSLVDLTETVVDLESSRAGLPAPDIDDQQELAARRTPSELVLLIQQAAENANPVGVYAASVQLILQHPQTPRGWAELSRAAAERREWTTAKAALERAMEHSGPLDAETAEAIGTALCILAEQNEMKDFSWRNWVDDLEPELRSLPQFVSLYVYFNSSEAETLVPLMMSSGGADSAKASLVAAMAAYNAHKYEEVYRLLREAFERDPSTTLWEIVYNYGAQVDQVIRKLVVSDEMAQWLSDLSQSSKVELLIASSHAPESFEMALRARELALERGLPSPILVTHPKTASVSVANIFSSGFQLPTLVYSLQTMCVVAPWTREYLRGGACYTTHLHWNDGNIARLVDNGARDVIVHIRDPRQLVISLLEHCRSYPTQVPASHREVLLGPIDQALEFAVSVNGFLGSILAYIQGWYEAAGKVNIHFTTFEEFVTDRHKFVDRLLMIYGGDRRYFDESAAFNEHAKIDYHRRKGLIDEWRTRLTPKQIQLLNDQMPSEYFERFGWKE